MAADRRRSIIHTELNDLEEGDEQEYSDHGSIGKLNSFNHHLKPNQSFNHYGERKASIFMVPTIAVIDEISQSTSSRNSSFGITEIDEEQREGTVVPKIFQNNVSISTEEFKNIMEIKQLQNKAKRCGFVFKCLERSEMIEMAVTRLKLENLDSWLQNKDLIQKQTKFLVEEFEHFCQLRNVRIIRYFGYFLDDARFYMYREYLPAGSVADKLASGPLSEEFSTKILRQTAEALNYLHNLTPSIAHKNLRVSNILLTLSEDIKLSDIGPSLQVNQADEYEEGESDTTCPHYRTLLLSTAPEQMNFVNEPHMFKPSNDIWSLGCIFVQMLTNDLPYESKFQNYRNDKLFKELFDNRTLNTGDRLDYKAESLAPKASFDSKNLIDCILKWSDDERPTAEDILKYEQIQVNERLFEVHQLTMGAKKRRGTEIYVDDYGSEEQDIYGERTPKIYKRDGSKEKVYSELLARFVPVEDDESEILLNGSNPRSDYNLRSLKQFKEVSDEKYIFNYFKGRIVIFLRFFVKWSLLVLMTAASLFAFASAVFVAIYIIYKMINLVCQCRLNEGFIVLIALILLPIMILLGTLCCNNACQKYQAAEENGKLKKSKLYYSQPEKDVKLCGIIAVVGSKHHHKSMADKKSKKDEGDLTAPMHLDKGKIVNDIAKLA